MSPKTCLILVALCLSTIGPDGASASSAIANAASVPATPASSDFLQFAASKKYHRLKPGCRASFCKPGYRWGDYRRYERRKNFGRFVAGITLGAIIITAANTVPRRPSSDLCWYWSNNSRTRGYWDYCY